MASMLTKVSAKLLACCADYLNANGMPTFVFSTDWHAQFTRVSVELGTALRDKKALEASNLAIATELTEWVEKATRFAQQANESDVQISVIRSQLAAEQRSNQALRGVVTRMKKSREKVVKEVAK